MRRGSLVAPFLLILIGIVFLINNVRPEFPLLDLAGRYWPFLLIIWGSLRLFEVLFWYYRRRPLPESGVSGGEWALVVLIAVVGSGFFVASRVTAGWPGGAFGIRGLEVFGEAYDYPLSGEKRVGKTPRILVENLRGNARIVGTDEDMVRVTGRKTIRALRQEDADQANEQAPFEITQSGDQIVIRTNQDRVSGERRLSTDLEISLPRGTTLEARGRYGDFDITDLTGKVEINSDNAGVRLQNLGNDVRVDLRRSDIIRATGIKGTVDVKASKGEDLDLENIAGRVSVQGSFSGELRFQNLQKPMKVQSEHTDLYVEKVPGEVRVELGDLTASDVVGPFRLSSRRSRDVEISNFTEAMEISLDRGDVILRPQSGKAGLGKLDVKTRSGNIELALPPGSKFDLIAATDRGSVENEFGAPLVAQNQERGGSVKGKTGAGPELRLTTDRGEIRVRKSTGDEITERIPRHTENDGEGPEPPSPPESPRRPRTEMQ